MIELISSLFKQGDSIKLEYGHNAQVVSGTILKIAGNSIAIKKFEGGIAGIKGDEIISFDTMDTPNQTSAELIQDIPNENQTLNVQANVNKEKTENVITTIEPSTFKDKGILNSSRDSEKQLLKEAKQKSKNTLKGEKANSFEGLASLLGVEKTISQMREKEKEDLDKAVIREMGVIESI